MKGRRRFLKWNGADQTGQTPYLLGLTGAIAILAGERW
jgi:hypothetical protein